MMDFHTAFTTMLQLTISQTQQDKTGSWLAIKRGDPSFSYIGSEGKEQERNKFRMSRDHGKSECGYIS